MSRPLVTCGVTAFNAEATIERAVRSALAQAWRPIEVIVVDDASVDTTPDILVRLAEAHSEIRVFRQAENAGVGAARNRILKEANGAFVAFFDDDDESLPERVDAQVRRIIDYETAFSSGLPVICHTARRAAYPDGRDQVEGTIGERQGVPAPAGLPVAHRILFGAPLEDGYGACPTCSQMARLETYQALEGFDGTLRRGEDTDFNIRLALAGGHFVGIAQPLVHQTMTRTTDKSLATEYESMFRLLEKHRAVLEAAGFYGFSHRWLEMKQAWMEGRRGTFLWRLARLVSSRPIITGRRLLDAGRHTRRTHAVRAFLQTEPSP